MIALSVVRSQVVMFSLFGTRASDTLRIVGVLRTRVSYLRLEYFGLILYNLVSYEIIPLLPGQEFPSKYALKPLSYHHQNPQTSMSRCYVCDALVLRSIVLESVELPCHRLSW